MEDLGSAREFIARALSRMRASIATQEALRAYLLRARIAIQILQSESPPIGSTRAEELAREAARQAITKLRARPAPGSPAPAAGPQRRT